MTENTEQRSVPSSITRSVIAEMLMENFDKLSVADRHLLMYGSLYLGGNAGLAGLISNSLYRRILNIRAGLYSSSLPMLVLPFLTTTALQSAIVCSPLLTGDINCPICSVIRGALIGVVSGGLYPIALALPVNLGLAARYSSSVLPEKGTVMRYCMDISKPIVRKMRAVIVLQAVFGGYLGFRQFQAYAQLAELTFSKGEVLGN